MALGFVRITEALFRFVLMLITFAITNAAAAWFFSYDDRIFHGTFWQWYGGLWIMVGIVFVVAVIAALCTPPAKNGG